MLTCGNPPCAVTPRERYRPSYTATDRGARAADAKGLGAGWPDLRAVGVDQLTQRWAVLHCPCVQFGLPRVPQKPGARWGLGVG